MKAKTIIFLSAILLLASTCPAEAHRHHYYKGDR